MQVFYVNIGGGEPTVRRDFWELRRLRDRARRRRQVLDQRLAASRRRSRRGSRRATTSTSRSRSTARRPRSTTRSAAPARTTRRSRAMEHLRGRGLRAASRSRSSSRARTPASSTRSRRSPTATARSCGSPGCGPSGRGADVWDELHPTAAQQRELYDWLLAHGEEVLTGDSFFHLVRLRRGAAGPEPVRRRARRLPDRPGRRRLRLPVRDPRRVPRRQRPRRRRLRPASGASRSCSPSCASRRRPAPARRCGLYDACRGGCMAAKFFTGLPLDGPDPECVLGHGERAARRARATPRRRARRSTTRAGAPRGRACDEDPLADFRLDECPLADGPARWPARARGSSRSPRPSGGRSRRAADARSTARCVAGAERGRHARGQRRRVRRARLRAADRHRPAGGARDLATTVMGQPISMPVIISPTGVQAVHPDGEVAVARAAAARGHGDGPQLVREQAGRGGRRGQPADVLPDLLARARASGSRRSLERARAAGAAGLIVTLDWSFAHRPRLGQPGDPGAARPEARCASLAPEALVRPRWLLDFLRSGGLPDLDGRRTWPRRASRPPTFFGAYGEWMQDAAALAGRTSPGCASSGTGRSCSRASCAPTTPGARSTPAPTRSRSPTTAATTSTARRRRSAPCPRSSTRSATRSRSCSTAASAAAATSSRRSRSAPAP